MAQLSGLPGRLRSLCTIFVRATRNMDVVVRLAATRTQFMRTGAATKHPHERLKKFVWLLHVETSTDQSETGRNYHVPLCPRCRRDDRCCIEHRDRAARQRDAEPRQCSRPWQESNCSVAMTDIKEMGSHYTTIAARRTWFSRSITSSGRPHTTVFGRAATRSTMEAVSGRSPTPNTTATSALRPDQSLGRRCQRCGTWVRDMQLVPHPSASRSAMAWFRYDVYLR